MLDLPSFNHVGVEKGALAALRSEPGCGVLKPVHTAPVPSLPGESERLRGGDWAGHLPREHRIHVPDDSKRPDNESNREEEAASDERVHGLSPAPPHGRYE
jgi:hypothetical protein